MKTTSLFGLLLLAITSHGWSAPGPSRLYADYFGGKIARVSADGAADWEFPANDEHPRVLRVVRDGGEFGR